MVRPNRILLLSLMVMAIAVSPLAAADKSNTNQLPYHWHPRDGALASRKLLRTILQAPAPATNLPADAPFTAISMGGYFACGLQVDNSAWCWGACVKQPCLFEDLTGTAQSGPISIGLTLQPQLMFVNVAWQSITSGNIHVCGIKVDGTAWCWGNNQLQQLGVGPQGATIRTSTLPVAVAGGGTYKKIQAGGVHTCGIKSDFSLWCWGSNTYGQLGDGTRVTNGNPVQVTPGTNYQDVCTGYLYSCGVDAAGSIFCWGDGNALAASGSQANGIPWASPSAVPVNVNAGTGWAKVSCGDAYLCATKTDGSLYCWGSNSCGQVGDGTQTYKPQPTPVAGGGKWKSVSTAYDFCNVCGIQTDDTLWCWGGNDLGQVGIGNFANATIPTKIASDVPWSSVSVRYPASCAIKKDQSAWCWGGNQNGQIGDGGKANKQAPSPVAGAYRWKTENVIGGGGTVIVTPVPTAPTAPKVPPTQAKPVAAPPNRAPAPAPFIATSDDSSDILPIIIGVVVGVLLLLLLLLLWCCWRKRKARKALLPAEADLKEAEKKDKEDGEDDEEQANGKDDHGDENGKANGDGDDDDHEGSITLAINDEEDAIGDAGDGDKDKPDEEAEVLSTPRDDIESFPVDAEDTPVKSPDGDGAGGVGAGAAAAAAGGAAALVAGAAALAASGDDKGDKARGTEVAELDKDAGKSGAGNADEVFAMRAAVDAGEEKKPAWKPAGGAAEDVLPARAGLAEVSDEERDYVEEDGYVSETLPSVSSLTSLSSMVAGNFAMEDVKILRLIGQGKAGKVYLAEWNNKEIALRVLAEGNNAKTSAISDRLTHDNAKLTVRQPNVVQLSGFCGYPPAIAYEYCGKGSIKDLLEQGTKSADVADQLTWNRRLMMALDAAKAILHLHTRYPIIVHGHIKPSNLLVTDDWRTKVGDVKLREVVDGAVKLYPESGDDPRYLAPEVLRGKKPTAASDVYSFGVVLYELLTWQRPFGSRDNKTITQAKLNGEKLVVPPVDSLPAMSARDAKTLGSYIELIGDCMKDAPEQRPDWQEIMKILRSKGRSGGAQAPWRYSYQKKPGQLNARERDG